MKGVIVSARARREIERIDRWWLEYRPAAPALFQDELREAFELVRQQPLLGHPYQPRPGVRRLLLRAARYHVYYELERTNLVVLAVWSAVRGRGPKL